MLRLIDVCKSFKYGKNRFLVLDKINLDFKKQELVFILGKSGSGKSTLLNIIGGILDIDSGKVMIDDKDITKFNNNMLCNYRNNMVGYIFQDYHLVEYMSVIDNIKLGQTINGNENRIEEVLRELGIYSKRKIVVNKLSGGEKQRVAIARAIINNPDILLCDEPTGAMDSVNGVKIMDILKKISRNKLVIVVSHDQFLADKYADRIINIIDGKVEYIQQEDKSSFKEINKKRISLFSIFKLAIKNLCLKKVRTLFTSLTISIGVICMLLVLCLSRSFNDEITDLENNFVSSFPISIYNGEYEINNEKVISSNTKIIRKDMSDYVHINKIDNKYIEYVNNIDEIGYIRYDYDISMPVISENYKLLDKNYMKVLPSNEFLSDNYDVLCGDMPSSIYDIVLKVDSNNNVSSELLDVFNIDSDIQYEDIIGKKLKVILNDDYYIKNGDYYLINSNNIESYNSSGIELKVVGIVREKKLADSDSYFYYDNDLLSYIFCENSKSDIVLSQLGVEFNILGINTDRESLLSYLGYNTVPIGINIYVSSLDDKDKVIEKLEEYNKNNLQFIYRDTMNDAVSILRNIIEVITIILILFSSISILISSLMILILTNNRVMERIREIGILRSLGARNSDITKLFNIENLIIGVISSVIGIIIIKLISNPINLLFYKFIGEEMFNIYNDLVIITLIFNIFIVVLSGYIPSKMASRKGIFDCIYNRF